jgi:hypothetical protein
MDPAVANGVRRWGIDVLTAQEAGRCGYDDDEQLAFATGLGRVMVTFDVDYQTLHNAGASHAGIAWAPARKYSIGELISCLALVHGVYTADEMMNHLEYL